MPNTWIYEELGEGPWEIKARWSAGSGRFFQLEISRRDPDAARIVLQFESLEGLESFYRQVDAVIQAEYDESVREMQPWGA